MILWLPSTPLTHKKKPLYISYIGFFFVAKMVKICQKQNYLAHF
jgi:hypothetical protein